MQHPHRTSRAAAHQTPLTAYLLAYFTDESVSDGEQIYFSTSRDALHWTDLHGGRPMLVSHVDERGVRDPALIRAPAGDKFFLLATDLRIASGKGWDTALHRGSTAIIAWESGNLVDWFTPRRIDIAASIPGAGCMWAPEAIYDDQHGDYFVYWTTVTMEAARKQGRIYYARTRAFRTFTPAKLYVRRADDAFMLDTQIVKTADADPSLRYVRVWAMASSKRAMRCSAPGARSATWPTPARRASWKAGSCFRITSPGNGGCGWSSTRRKKGICPRRSTRPGRWTSCTANSPMAAASVCSM
jgi:hypothetical protein